MKVFAFGFLIVLGIVFIAPHNNSYAADVYADCTIYTIVQNEAVSNVKLTEVGGAFTNKKFFLPSTKTKEILAMLLTAFSMKEEIRILYDDTNDTIKQLALLNE